MLVLANPNYLNGDPITLADRVSSRFLNSYLMPNYTGRSEPFDVRGPSLLGPFNTKPTFVAAGKINLNTLRSAPTGLHPGKPVSHEGESADIRRARYRARCGLSRN